MERLMTINKNIKTKDDYTRDILNKIRNIQEDYASKKVLKEEKEDKDKKQGAIAITDEPIFGQNALTSQIEQFRASVESGAQFSNANPEKPSDSPLIYLPDTGNLVFSGVIPCLNNLKWQFVLKTSTGNGCFIWSDGMIVNKDNLQIINKLYGFYENWKNEWNSESADLEKMMNNLQNK